MSDDTPMPTNTVDVDSAPTKDTILLRGGKYDKAKNLVLLGFPLLITFYGTFAAAWGLPHTEQVLITLGALNLLLGGIVKISQVQYDNSDEQYDGKIIVDQYDTEEGPKKVARLALHGDEPVLMPGQAIKFKVQTGERIA